MNFSLISVHTEKKTRNFNFLSTQYMFPNGHVTHQFFKVVESGCVIGS